MKNTTLFRGSMVAVLLTGCASGRSPSSTASAPPGSAQALALSCTDADREISLCAIDELVSVDRMPIDLRGGEVLTGARMVYRAAPDRTAASLQHAIDCQTGGGSIGQAKQPYPLTSYCPLAIAGVTGRVREVGQGLEVEVRPNDAAASHRISHSVAHGRLAAAMQAFESVECRGIPPAARAACPLLGPVTAIDDAPGGVRVEFVPSVSLDTVLAGMRCHYSFAQARGFSEEATACPLYLRGLRVERSKDGRAIEVTVTSAAMVNEIRKRAREEAVFSREAPGRP
jgi:TusA-related sulfurtransferase